MRNNLIQMGEALYGPLFQSALARDLGVSARTMRRWVAGTHNPPEGLQDELHALVRARIALLQKLLSKG